jgi:hypothetical protein
MWLPLLNSQQAIHWVRPALAARSILFGMFDQGLCINFMQLGFVQVEL